LSLYEVAQQKIIKYTQRKKDKHAEPILFFEWPLFFNALNVKLTSIKKDHVTPEELPHVQMICCILQNLITMSRTEIIYIFGKIRTMPVEIIKERDSLKELIKTMEITKLSLEEENLDLSTKSSILNQKLFNLERENTNLRDELNYMQSSGEITRQPEIIEENDPVNLKNLKKQLKEKLESKQSKKKNLLAVQQHQTINDNLLDELALTTKILNQTLSEKNSLQSTALELEQKINILEQKLETYQKEYVDLTGDIKCRVISSIFEVLIPCLLLQKDTKICQTVTDLNKLQIPTTTVGMTTTTTTTTTTALTTIPSSRNITATSIPTTSEKNSLNNPF